jgi:hypothetical protein
MSSPQGGGSRPDVRTGMEPNVRRCAREANGQRSMWPPFTAAFGRPVSRSPYADRCRARAARQFYPRDVPPATRRCEYLRVAGVLKTDHAVCNAIARLYSSQSGCAPAMERKQSTKGSAASGMSSTSAVPTPAPGPSKSSERMQILTSEPRRGC